MTENSSSAQVFLGKSLDEPKELILSLSEGTTSHAPSHIYLAEPLAEAFNQYLANCPVNVVEAISQYLANSPTLHIPRPLLWARQTDNLSMDDCVILTYLYQQTNKRTLNEIQDISEIIQRSTVYTRRLFRRLNKIGFLVGTKMQDSEIVLLLKGEKPQLLAKADLFCEWCKGQTTLIHKHHYPTKKSDGGVDTVSICASCHAEFHGLQASVVYKLSQKALAFFEGACHE
jgi:hypothetical protein